MSRKEQAASIKKRLNTVSKNIKVSHVELADLLYSVHSNEFYIDWGFETFEVFIAESDLGLSMRQAYYLVQIYGKAISLEISKKELEQLHISKLKYIFALDTGVYGSFIKSAVVEAKYLTLNELVLYINGHTKGNLKMPSVYFSVSTKQRDTIEKAVRLAKDEYGCTTKGSALSEICQFYCASNT